MPLLEYGRNNNLGELKKKLADKLTDRFGAAAMFMKTGVHFVPLVPSAETLRSRGRSEKQIEELQLQAAADSEKVVREIKLKFPSIFSCLMTSLNLESRSAVELDGIVSLFGSIW